MPLAHVSLGSNVGDRQAHLDFAIEALSSTAATVVRSVSSYRESVPIGGPPGQCGYLNAAASLETTRPPCDLLRSLHVIEREAGRVRTVRWGERTLDLDLLLYDDQVIRTPELCLPHPRMALRRFVLAPLSEIAKDTVDPVTRRTIASLLINLDRRPSHVAMAAPPIPESASGNPTLILELDKASMEPTSWALPLQRRLLDSLNTRHPSRGGTSPGEDSGSAVEAWSLGESHPRFLSRSNPVDRTGTEHLEERSCVTGPLRERWLVSSSWIDLIEDHPQVDPRIVDSECDRKRTPAGLTHFDPWKKQRRHEMGFPRSRADMIPPTFVVASRSEVDRFGIQQPWTEYRRPICWDVPVLILADPKDIDGSLAEVIAACQATRAC